VAIEFAIARCTDASQPFVFVVGGETAPTLDRGATPTASTADQPLLLYEYWWTIANFDRPGTSGEWSARRRQKRLRIPPIRRGTAEPSNDTDRRGFTGYTAQIDLYFPTEQGWRVRDRAAAVRYLTPLPPDLGEEIAKDWQDITPILQGASAVAGAASSFAGPAAAETAKTLAALAQVKCNSVPQTSLPWSVTCVATTVGKEVYEGLTWTLSETLLERLGGRVMGSVVVSVVPAALQGGPSTTREGGLRAHAALYGDGREMPMTCAPELPVVLRVNPQ
jgi:hypothetical protein